MERLKLLMPTASKRTLKQLLDHDRVVVDGTAVRGGAELVADSARIEIRPKEARATADDAIPIVHIDDDIIVVDKPPGLISVSERSSAQRSAWSELRHALRERGTDSDVHLVHRLDKEASGLLVFARTDAAREGLKAAFATHAIDRHYAAIVSGQMDAPSGECAGRLVELDDARHHVRSLRRGDPRMLRDRSEDALTRWFVRHSGPRVSALEVRLETGRKHQVRVHLSEAGHPILGDELYDGAPSKRLMLHAWILGFQHPITGRKLRFVCRPSAAFERIAPGAFAGPAAITPRPIRS